MVRRSSLDPTDAKAARAAALDMLARRDRCSSQLFAKLTDRGYASDTATGVVRALALENLVNDRRYAEHFVAYHAGRGQGPLKVRGEMRRLGVDGELIDEFVGAYPHWDARAQEARIKKFGAVAPTQYPEVARQSRFLAYRGFTGSQIRSALKCDPDYET